MGSFPNIRGFMQHRGVPAASGEAFDEYVLPAIEHRGEIVMGSVECAEYLETNFPNAPLLFPNRHCLPLARTIEHLLFSALRPVISPHYLLPKIIGLLDESGAEYYRRTREEYLGYRIVDEIWDDKRRYEEAWQQPMPALELVNDILKNQPVGPFLGGKERAYPDLVLLAFLLWWKRLDDDIYERVIEKAPYFQKVWDASTDILPLRIEEDTAR